jgi:hypothetical protein
MRQDGIREAMSAALQDQLASALSDPDRSRARFAV